MEYAISSKSAAAHAALTGAPQVRAALDFLKADHERCVREQVEITKIPAPTFHEERRAAYMYGFLEQQIAAGRQVFVVCPLIEQSGETPSGSEEMQAVTEYRAQVAQKLLPGRRIGLLHGRMVHLLRLSA